ncbi:MAG: CdaR family protein [Pseudobdellovibrio sp.]
MRAKYAQHQDEINKVKSLIFENFSYKAVALIISLILWLSLLNKRDFITTKEFDVDILTAENLVVLGQTTAKLKVQVSGPQPLLKKFKDSSQIIAFDMTDKAAGFYDLDVSLSKIDVPKGIKVIGIKPNTIHVEIIDKQKADK